MATMEDVAKAAKVSRATVSRVLSNYPSIKPETRQQVMYWVRELHYEPNQVAQNLAGHHTNLIGVLFSDLCHIFHCCHRVSPFLYIRIAFIAFAANFL